MSDTVLLQIISWIAFYLPVALFELQSWFIFSEFFTKFVEKYSTIYITNLNVWVEVNFDQIVAYS